MPEGLAYEGTWKAGEINGEGKLSQQNGDVYIGTLVNGRRDGLCKVTYANGDIYEGNFADDQRSGQGKFIGCLLYTSPSPRDFEASRMPSSA